MDTGDTWSASRLRRRRTPSTSLIDVVEINGDDDDDYVPPKPKGRKTQKTVIIRAPEVEKARRASMGKQVVELHMECYEDALSTVQLRANHFAKEAHAMAMKQIQAAHEGRLSFKEDGTPVIHAQPVIMRSPTVTSPFSASQMVNRTGYGVSLRAMHTQQHRVQPQVQAYNSPRSRFTGPSANVQQGARAQLSQNSIPVGRVVAQPRKVISQPVSGTAGFGVKRSFQDLQDQVNLSTYEADAKRKRKSLEDEGDWVPLDEFYYGKLEGNTMYTEEKGEFRFKCWYCNKMLYNNLKAMMHLQSHIDSEKQQNLDLSDLTQCKHCYKQFDTPFEMQTHIEKVHLSNSSVLMCRICEKDHDSNHALSQHMRSTHNAREMPYRCQCCNFQSSMYGDVVDHFKKKHDSSQNLLCLYCLRAFKIKLVSNGWGSTQNYYHHLVKHQSKSRSKKCSSCKLTFISPGELKTHQKKDHVSNSKAAGMAPSTSLGSQQQVMIQVKGNVAGSGVKSLNAPAVMKHLDLSRLRIPLYAGQYHCYECKGSMSNVDHFKNHKECSMCRYATTCSSAYANHMLSFHSGRSALSTYLGVTREHPLPVRRYCACGFSSRYGNKIANHMVFCYKRTCFSEKPDPNKLTSPEEPEADPRRRPGASILDALGLVKKQTAKRSADGTEILDTPPNQAETEAFVGVTNLSMAQTLRDSAEQNELDNERADDPDFENDGDSDVADVGSDNDDDNDTDFRPGRFSKPPKQDRPRQSGSLFVKMNFFKNKQKKETPVKTLPDSEIESSAITAPPSDDSGEVNNSETTAVEAVSSGDLTKAIKNGTALTAPSMENAGEVTDKNSSHVENLATRETTNAEQSEGNKNIGQSTVKESEDSGQLDNKLSDVPSDKIKQTNNVSSDDQIDFEVSENTEGKTKSLVDSAIKDSDNAENILPKTSEANISSENTAKEVTDKPVLQSEEITPEDPQNDMEKEILKLDDKLAEEEATTNQDKDASEMAGEQADSMETKEPKSPLPVKEFEDETANNDGESCGSEEASMETDESSKKPGEASPANEKSPKDHTSEVNETPDEVHESSEVGKSSGVIQEESINVSESQKSGKSPEDELPSKITPEDSPEDVGASEETTVEKSKTADPESSVYESPTGFPETSQSGQSPSKTEEAETPKSLPGEGKALSVEEKDSTEKEKEPLGHQPLSSEQGTKNFSESPSKASRWDKTEQESPNKRHSDSSDSHRKGGNDSRDRDSHSDSRDRDSHSGHRSGSSSYDRSDRHHSGSHYRHDRSYDSGHHGSRYDRDRDDKYRDRNSDRRYDDRGYSSRDHNRYDNRGYSSRDYDHRGNRYDRDQGHRRDSQGHGNRQNRYDNQRRDYY